MPRQTSRVLAFVVFTLVPSGIERVFVGDVARRIVESAKQESSKTDVREI
jgi:hypothetical protein